MKRSLLINTQYHENRLKTEVKKQIFLLKSLIECEKNIQIEKEALLSLKEPEEYYLPLEIKEQISEYVHHNSNICESIGLLSVDKVYYNIFKKRNNFHFLQYDIERNITPNVLMKLDNKTFGIYNNNKKVMEYIKYPTIPHVVISSLLINKDYVINSAYHSFIINELSIILKKELLVIQDKRDNTFSIEENDKKVLLKSIEHCLNFKEKPDIPLDQSITERNRISRSILLIIYLLFTFRQQKEYSSLLKRECPFIRNSEGKAVEPVKHHIILKDISFYDYKYNNILSLEKLEHIYYIDGIKLQGREFDEQVDQFINNIENPRERNKIRLAFNGSYYEQKRTLFFNENFYYNNISNEEELEEVEEEKKLLHIRKAKSTDPYRDIVIFNKNNKTFSHILEESDDNEEFKKYLFQNKLNDIDDNFTKSDVINAYTQVIYSQKYNLLRKKILDLVNPNDPICIHIIDEDFDLMYL